MNLIGKDKLVAIKDALTQGFPSLTKQIEGVLSQSAEKPGPAKPGVAAAAECGPADFSELLLVPGVGPRTVRALAMVAEVLHGAPCRFSDPARFSLAHGGKDRHPFPVPIRVYDQTIQALKSAEKSWYCLRP